MLTMPSSNALLEIVESCIQLFHFNSPQFIFALQRSRKGIDIPIRQHNHFIFQTQSECMSGIILKGETTITSILHVSDGFYLTGSKKENNYKLIVIKLNPSHEVEWERTFGNETTDFEGQSSILTDDGLLICGCSEGHATDTGGRDWKAYLLLLSKSGKLIWERSLRIRGNECAYNVLCGENIYLFGETKGDDGNCSFFLSCLDSEGGIRWMRQYGNYPNIMAGGMISVGDGCIFSGNVKIDNAWHVMICKVGADGEVEWEKKVPGNFIFKMHELEDGFLLAGEISKKIFLAKVGFSGNLIWQYTYGKGVGITTLVNDNCFFIGGEDGDGRPTLCQVGRDGKSIRQTSFEREGGIEAMAKSGGDIIMAIHHLEPKEHTELVTLALDAT